MPGIVWDMPDELVSRLRAVAERVARACESVGRDPAGVGVLLAAKGQRPEVVRAAIEAGHQVIGHNRVQEMLALEAELVDLPHQVHVIGSLQSNKANKVVRLAHAVQSVDRLALADRLDRLAGEIGRTLGVYLQVNTSGEPTKAGVAPEGAVDLAAAVGALKHLELRGFMTIGANSMDVQVVRDSYERLALVRDAVLTVAAPGTERAGELSMGMSRDLEIAIAAGATMVRVGTAAFGPRSR